MSLEQAIRLLIIGVEVGSIYALVALSVVLLYRTSRVLNFGQGELALLACFLTFVLTTSLGVPLWLAFLAGLAASAVAAGAFYFFLLRRAKAQDPMSLLILTLGFSLFANGALSLIFGVDNKAMPGFVDVIDTWTIAGFTIAKNSVLVAVAGLILMLLLYVFVQKSKIGLAMRAVSQNPEVAKALGIPVNVVLISSWAVAAILGGAAALLFAPTISLTPNLMLDPLNKGFAAAVVGGMTSLPGAVLGGYLLGVIETYVGNFVPAFKLALAFVLVILVLVFRPHGLLGEKETRRA
ncbi:MAG: branched-chain amino acid ABC transporter permease [Deinococcales bacterium]